MGARMNNRSFGARRFRMGLAIAVAGTLALGTSTGAGADSERPWRKPHHLKHVFVIVLENYKAEDVTPAAAPYLASLMQRGVTLDEMYGVDHASLSNYVAMTSGNSPNASTKADCFQYDCIFEAPLDRNIGDQLEERGRSWKAYMESMPAPCAHATVSGQLDPYLVGYASRHNPFMYYRDIVGPDITVTPPRCVEHDVPLTQLSTDLENRAVIRHLPAGDAARRRMNVNGGECPAPREKMGALPHRRHFCTQSEQFSRNLLASQVI